MQSQINSNPGTGSHNALTMQMAQKFAVDPDELFGILRVTAFRSISSDKHVGDEQMYALLIVADQYNLNPFTQEVEAYQGSGGGIIPVVGVDGWCRIANEQANFDGVEFNYSDEMMSAQGTTTTCPAWIEVVVHRKDRSRPTVIREYLDECYQKVFVNNETGTPTLGAWQTHPKRCLRHKALIQAYRVAFSFVGIYDEDEAARIVASQSGTAQEQPAVVPVAGQVKKDADSGPVIKPVIAAETPPEIVFTIDFDQVAIDAFVEKLTARAKSSNQWQACTDLINERLSGNALIYAVKAFDDAKEACLNQADNAETSEEKIVIPEVAHCETTFDGMDVTLLDEQSDGLMI